MTDPADPVKFQAFLDEQEYRMRIRLGDELFEWLETQIERRNKMSHHAEDFDPEMKETMREFFKNDNSHEDLLKRFTERGEPLGATQMFPEGKLTEQDQGEIRMAVFHGNGKVVLDFGTQVTWVGMNPNQAIDLGNALIKHGRDANKSREAGGTPV